MRTLAVRDPASGARPLVVGHRGAPLQAPENSPASFAAAAAAGADWVELDVRRSGDDVAVVAHDPVTADGSLVADLPASDLVARGVWTLAEVIDLMPSGLGVDVEIKNLPTEPDYDEEERIAALTAEVIGRHDVERPWLVSSFNPATVAAVERRLPGLGTGLVTGPTVPLPAAVEVASEFGLVAVCPHAGAPRLLDGLRLTRAIRMPVMVWTVDDESQAAALATAGVDALCTNDPGLLSSVLASCG